METARLLAKVIKTMPNDSDVLDFWFNEISPGQWFQKSDAFDQEISQRFTEIHMQASQGECYTWRKTISGRLAEIIVLDQFSRNLFRDDYRSFAYDGIALVLAQEAIQTGEDQQLPAQQRSFLYMPFMHSESLAMHVQAVELFSQPGLEMNIIERFGRYPHRNAILNRESTEEELAFLKEPDSHF